MNGGTNRRFGNPLLDIISGKFPIKSMLENVK
jgi:hypothetical protein